MLSFERPATYADSSRIEISDGYSSGWQPQGNRNVIPSLSGLAVYLSLVGTKPLSQAVCLQHITAGTEDLIVMDYEALKDQWSEVEDRDGIRLSWNTFPSSRMVSVRDGSCINVADHYERKLRGSLCLSEPSIPP